MVDASVSRRRARLTWYKYKAVLVWWFELATVTLLPAAAAIVIRLVSSIFDFDSDSSRVDENRPTSNNNN